MSPLLLTGAGSSSVVFDPTSVAGLAAWWSADALVLNDGDAVATWADGSGNTRNLTQATAGLRPTYKTAIVNGKPVVRFSVAATTWIGGADLHTLTAGSIFVVMKKNADPAANDTAAGAWVLGDAGASDTHIPYTDGVIYDSTGTTVRKTTVNPTPSLAAWNIYEVRTAAGLWTSLLNGTQLFTTATNTVSFSTSARLGISNQSTRYFDGDIAQVLIYDSNLGVSDTTYVRAGLKAEYATP